MPLRLDSQSADFADRFRNLLALKRETAQDVEQAVRDIIADVVARGDRALFELTAKFDRVDLAKTRLRVATAEIDAAEKSCDGNAIAALKLARDSEVELVILNHAGACDHEKLFLRKESHAIQLSPGLRAYARRDVLWPRLRRR